MLPKKRKRKRAPILTCGVAILLIMAGAATTIGGEQNNTAVQFTLVSDNGSATPTPSATPSPCFIATAAYGTPLHEDIDVLRDFRDEYLMPNPVGKKFVKAYYETSPPIAEVISEHEWLRIVVREAMVKPLVYFVKKIEKGKSL